MTGAVTRSIPDQEVLKHCLSTLRNLARYARLADVLITHQGSVETILRELLKYVFSVILRLKFQFVLKLGNDINKLHGSGTRKRVISLLVSC